MEAGSLQFRVLPRCTYIFRTPFSSLLVLVPSLLCLSSSKNKSSLSIISWAIRWRATQKITTPIATPSTESKTMKKAIAASLLPVRLGFFISYLIRNLKPLVFFFCILLGTILRSLGFLFHLHSLFYAKSDFFTMNGFASFLPQFIFFQSGDRWLEMLN